MTRTSVRSASAAWVALLAFGWWFTDRRPFSPGALEALAVAAVVVVAAALVHRRRTRTGTPVPRAKWFRTSAVLWCVVVVAVVAWELVALPRPRATHPTISSMIESVEQYHVLRLALFVLWVALGWTIAS